MAKQSAAAKTNPAPVEVEEFADDFLDFEAPEGASEVTGDIEGYWDYKKSAIRCIPRSVKMFDGSKDSSKVSCLVLVELTRSIPIQFKNDDDEMVFKPGKIGDTVGIWYKPGMRAIVNKCGKEVYIKREPKKDKITNKKVKNPNPMKGFLVIAPPGGVKIPIIEDSREESAEMAKNGKVVPVLTAFHDRSKGAQRIPQPRLPEVGGEEGDEDENLFDDSDSE